MVALKKSILPFRKKPDTFQAFRTMLAEGMYKAGINHALCYAAKHAPVDGAVASIILMEWAAFIDEYSEAQKDPETFYFVTWEDILEGPMLDCVRALLEQFDPANFIISESLAHSVVYHSLGTLGE